MAWCLEKWSRWKMRLVVQSLCANKTFVSDNNNLECWSMPYFCMTIANLIEFARFKNYCNGKCRANSIRLRFRSQWILFLFLLKNGGTLIWNNLSSDIVVKTATPNQFKQAWFQPSWLKKVSSALNAEVGLEIMWKRGRKIYLFSPLCVFCLLLVSNFLLSCLFC